MWPLPWGPQRLHCPWQDPHSHNPTTSPDRKQVAEGEGLGSEGCGQGQLVRHLRLGHPSGQVPLAWGEVRGRGVGQEEEEDGTLRGLRAWAAVPDGFIAYTH